MFHSCSPSMLQCIGAGMFMCTLGYILLSAFGVVGVIVSDDVYRYLSCTAQANNYNLLILWNGTGKLVHLFCIELETH